MNDIINDILSVDEYRSFQTGANAPTRSEDIASAINLTFIQLNGICNNQIRIRWEITDVNNKLFLSDEKKQCIKDAFLLQTKYNLDYDNDTSEGTMQGSWGSNSQSITRPKRDKISQDVLNLLTDAGVYLQFTTQTIKTPATSGVRGANWRCEFDSYITLEEADQKYVPRYSPFEVSSTRLFCYDENRNWTTISIEDLRLDILDNYYTKPEVDEKFINYYDIDAIDELLLQKQDIIDEDLDTQEKSIVGAINEVNGKAQGTIYSYAISLENNPNFNSTEASITATQIVDLSGNTISSDLIQVGSSVYITQLNVPDRWYAGNNTFYNLEVEKFKILNVYPIGSIYTTNDADFNPNTTFGGTWNRIEGKYLIGAGTYDSTHTYVGGTTYGQPDSWLQEHTHRILTYNGNVRHPIENGYAPNSTSDDIGNYWCISGTGTAGGGQYDVDESNFENTPPTNAGGYSLLANWGAKRDVDLTRTIIEKTGSSETLNKNLPQSLAVYMWERTA